MNLVYCEQCGGYTPEGYALCPSCMRKAGAGEKEVQAAAEVLELVNIINIGDTDASRKTAIESILKITKRLGGESFGN